MTVLLHEFRAPANRVGEEIAKIRQGAKAFESQIFEPKVSERGGEKLTIYTLTIGTYKASN